MPVTELAFFDVDGTLSAPQYPHPDGSMDIGFTTEGWQAYCEQEGENGYAFCWPLAPVKAFAEELKRAGCRLFVLSSCFHPNEPAAKRRFLREHYPGLFEDCFFVFRDEEKIPLIRKTAAAAGMPLSACMLVEDTYATLLKAYEAGIRPVHIANIIAGNIPGQSGGER